MKLWHIRWYDQVDKDFLVRAETGEEATSKVREYMVREAGKNATHSYGSFDDVADFLHSCCFDDDYELDHDAEMLEKEGITRFHE